MSKEEIIKEVISILETSDYVDPAEHLYDGLKQIHREITDTTIHDLLWALESSTVIDFDGKVAECANKIKQLLQQELVGEAYDNYFNVFEKEWIKQYDPILGDFNHEGRPITKEEFINKIKTDSEFSQRWGLIIQERELSLEERRELSPNSKTTDIFKDLAIDFNPNVKMGFWNDQMSLEDFNDDIKQEIHRSYNKENIPTKQITITYNDKTIESYE